MQAAILASLQQTPPPRAAGSGGGGGGFVSRDIAPTRPGGRSGWDASGPTRPAWNSSSTPLRNAAPAAGCAAHAARPLALHRLQPMTVRTDPLVLSTKTTTSVRSSGAGRGARGAMARAGIRPTEPTRRSAASPPDFGARRTAHHGCPEVPQCCLRCDELSGLSWHGDALLPL